MANTLSIATVLEKNRLDSDVPFLIALDIDVVDPSTGSTVEQLRVVRNDENLTINTQVYTGARFDITFSAESGAQPSVNLSISDISGAIQARMEQYGGGVGFKVTMKIINAGDLNSPPDIEEYFEVLTAQAADYRCEWSLGAENEVTKPFPRRTQRKDFCQWRYKSAECGYPTNGPLPTCSLKLQGENGCAEHGREISFGGFPGINSNGFRYG